MRGLGVAEDQPADFARMVGIRDVQADDRVLGSARLDPERSHDLGHGAETLAFPAPVPRRRVDPARRRGRTIEAVEAVEAAREGVDQDGAAVREHAGLGGERLLVAAPAGRQQQRLQQRQVGQPPDLDRRAAPLQVHVAGSGDDAVERRQDSEAVGPDGRVDAGRSSLGRSDLSTGCVELDEPTRRVGGADHLPLERRQHVAVREPRVAVRVTERQRIAERGGQHRARRLPQIEGERAAGVEPVGPQDAASRHRVLRVVRPRSDRPDRQRRDNRGIAGAARVGVDDRQEVALAPIRVAGPQEEEAAARRPLTRAAGARVTSCEQGRQRDDEREAVAHELGRDPARVYTQKAALPDGPLVRRSCKLLGACSEHGPWYSSDAVRSSRKLLGACSEHEI
jgi:hypothetical protein